MATEIPPPEDPMERALELLPWLKHLPENERREVLIDLIVSVKTSLELGSTGDETIERLTNELAAWHATAEVHADPELYEALTRPHNDLDDFVEVPRPRGTVRTAHKGMRPVGEPPVKPKRRCGASLPHEDAEQGWRWCGLSVGHTEPHMDLADHLYAWEDSKIVEVHTVDDVRAVPHHIHDFVGDEDTCVRDQGCQLTWGERCSQQREWESTWKGASADLVIVDEIQGFIPPQREANDG